jgi:signal transduction histidine kinase
MSSERDANWPRLLSLAVHEIRTPVSVGSGYLKMLVTTSDGALTERQLQFIGESQKQWARIATLAAEMSELSNLEAGTLKFDQKRVDVPRVLAEAVAALPEMEDRTVEVRLTTSPEPNTAKGDPVRLRTAFASVLFALRREIVTSSVLFVQERQQDYKGRPASWITVTDADHLARLAAATADDLVKFDEWRAGSGLRLAIARRILEAHGGSLWSPSDGSPAGAVMVLPH